MRSKRDDEQKKAFNETIELRLYSARNAAFQNVDILQQRPTPEGPKRPRE